MSAQVKEKKKKTQFKMHTPRNVMVNLYAIFQEKKKNLKMSCDVFKCK